MTHLYETVAAQIRGGTPPSVIAENMGRPIQHIHQATWLARKNGLLPETNRSKSKKVKMKKKHLSRIDDVGKAILREAKATKNNPDYEKLHQETGVSVMKLRQRVSYYRNKIGILPKLTKAQRFERKSAGASSSSQKKTEGDFRVLDDNDQTNLTPADMALVETTEDSRPFANFPLKLETVISELDSCGTQELEVFKQILKSRYNW